MKNLMIIPVAAAIVVVSFLFINTAEGLESEFPQAPDFILEDLEGNTHTLADYEGRVIFLNFWATWCPPCRQEIPGFMELHEQYKDQGMVILGISLDQKGEKVVKAFAENNDIVYPLALATQEIMDDYQPGQYIPVTITIDKDGRIRDRHVGFMAKNDMEKLFLQLNQ